MKKGDQNLKFKNAETTRPKSIPPKITIGQHTTIILNKIPKKEQDQNKITEI